MITNPKTQERVRKAIQNDINQMYDDLDIWDIIHEAGLTEEQEEWAHEHLGARIVVEIQ